MKKILKIIKSIMTWWPNKIFYTTDFKFIKYSKPDISFFGTSYGADIEIKHFTKLGQHFADWPLLEIFKIPYYLLTLPIFLITNLIWSIIIDILTPKHISKYLENL